MFSTRLHGIARCLVRARHFNSSAVSAGHTDGDSGPLYEGHVPTTSFQKTLLVRDEEL